MRRSQTIVQSRAALSCSLCSRSPGEIIDLSSKCFPRHFQAQSFDLLKLILRPLFELAEICALQRRKILRIAPKERQRSRLPVIPKANASSA